MLLVICEKFAKMKIFRKIRLKSFFGNNVKKYFAYAFGEIVLIVIGIFLAIQLNKVYEKSSKKDLEVKYLNGIIQDIGSDIQSFNSAIDGNESKQNALDNLLLSFAFDYKINDSLQLEYLSRLYRAYYFVPKNSVFQDLKFSGNLNVISEDTIRSKIIEYYNKSNEINEFMSYNRRPTTNINLFEEIDFDENSIFQLAKFPNVQKPLEVDPYKSVDFQKLKNSKELSRYIDKISHAYLNNSVNLNMLNFGLEYATNTRKDLQDYLTITNSNKE